MTSPLRAERLAARPLSPARPARPAPERTERPDLRVVPPPARRRRTGLAVSLVAAGVFCTLLGSAIFHSMLVSGQDHLDRNERQMEQERVQLQHDRLALAQAQSPALIAEKAAALGLVPATEQVWHDPAEGSAVTTGSERGSDQGGDASTSNSQTGQTGQTDGSQSTGTGAGTGQVSAPEGAR